MLIAIVLGSAVFIAALFIGQRIRRGGMRQAIVWTNDGVKYKCGRCRAWHVGVPNWHFDAPDDVMALPRPERAKRAIRDEDFYYLDKKWVFTLALLELPLHGQEEPYAWGVWVAMSGNDAVKFQTLYNNPHRVAGEAFLGRLSNAIPGYPDTRTLPVQLHVRASPTRPLVTVIDAEHPLARDQQGGVSLETLRGQITPLFMGAEEREEPRRS